jgi:hypothetical protein
MTDAAISVLLISFCSPRTLLSTRLALESRVSYAAAVSARARRQVVTFLSSDGCVHSANDMGRSQVSRTMNSVAAPIRRSPWTERIARLGFAAKGAVYMMIGALAILAASRNGGETTDTKGAVARIGEQPFGQVMLALIAIGLFGYALWRFLQAVVDTDGRGTDMKGIAMRVGGLISGVIHVGLAVFAFRLLLGNGSSGDGGESQQYWTAQVMAQPFGRWLIAAVGAAIVAVGFGQFVSAQRHKFIEHLRTGEMSASQRKWVKRAGEWGFSARGVVFAIVGRLPDLGRSEARSRPDARPRGGARHARAPTVWHVAAGHRSSGLGRLRNLHAGRGALPPGKYIAPTKGSTGPARGMFNYRQPFRSSRPASCRDSKIMGASLTSRRPALGDGRGTG